MKNLSSASLSIKNWAPDDRPREKMLLKGPEALSNSELLAILINNGNANRSAVDLAKDILKLVGDNLNDLGKLTLKEIQQVKGIGAAKAISITAALELGRRRHYTGASEKTGVTSSRDIAAFLKGQLKDLNHEVFVVIYLNRANKIKHTEIISRGGITGTVADPRIILKKALEAGATSLVLSHNHPSGNIKPSKADEEITHKIKQAANYFDIRVLDHIIVSDEGYFSFADEGML